jgi:hypothetical protein
MRELEERYSHGRIQDWCDESIEMGVDKRDSEMIDLRE